MSEANDFGRRLRIARVWAGYGLQADFGAALADRWPDWPVRSMVKRIELGTHVLRSDAMATWATRVSEFTGVPEGFLLHGWAGQSPGDAHVTQLLAGIDARIEGQTNLLQLLASATTNTTAPDGSTRPRP